MLAFWQRLTRTQRFTLSTVAFFLLLLPIAIILVLKPTSPFSRASLPATSPIITPVPSSQEVKVLVLKYLPTDSSGTRIDRASTGLDKGLEEVQNWIDLINNQGIEKLTEATKYHGYKNPDAQPYLRYSIVDEKEFFKRIPKHPNYNMPDYRSLLTNDVNICDYIDNQGVRQVWMWGYHFGDIAPNESNMSMGTNSRSFWNQTGYGDISNSARINDMPTCQNTYTLYNYNFDRGLGEFLEDHGHQLESVFMYLDWEMWQKKFVTPLGSPSPAINRCGWSHSPPNAQEDNYDWHNETVVLSDCEDWRPEGGGEVKEASCHTWQGSECTRDSGMTWKVWWMQNFPGYNNNIMCNNGDKLWNWWEFYGDLDSALSKYGRSLASGNCFSRTTIVPSPFPGPIVDPSPIPSPGPISYSQPINYGWTMVGLPVDKTEAASAEDFLREINSSILTSESSPSAAIKLYKYDAQNQNWQTHSLGSIDNNFLIVPGEGYFVLSKASGNATILGLKWQNSIPITIYRDWSLVSIYTNHPGITADSLLRTMRNAGIDARYLARWTGSEYEIIQYTDTGTFTIRPGGGFWIYNAGQTGTFQSIP